MQYRQTNKGYLVGDNISIVFKGELITDKEKLAETFNLQFINIVENTLGLEPKTLGNPNSTSKDEITLTKIVDNYTDHSSKQLKTTFP